MEVNSAHIASRRGDFYMPILVLRLSLGLPNFI